MAFRHLQLAMVAQLRLSSTVNQDLILILITLIKLLTCWLNSFNNARRIRVIGIKFLMVVFNEFMKGIYDLGKNCSFYKDAS